MSRYLFFLAFLSVVSCSHFLELPNIALAKGTYSRTLGSYKAELSLSGTGASSHSDDYVFLQTLNGDTLFWEEGTFSINGDDFDVYCDRQKYYHCIPATETTAEECYMTTNTCDPLPFTDPLFVARIQSFENGCIHFDFQSWSHWDHLPLDQEEVYCKE
jgi:hypothetical protein